MSEWDDTPAELADEPTVVPAGTDMAVMPHTGEVVDLADANAAARVYVALGEMESKIKDARTLVRRALVQHAATYGGDTMRIDAAEVKISHPAEIQWDVNVLRELRAAGLPEKRWEELVETTVTVKVKATVAKQIAKANPVYAKIIERAERRIPKPDTVTVALRAEET